jgi:hypothetical protein
LATVSSIGTCIFRRSVVEWNRKVRRVMFDSKKFWQLKTARHFSAAKGLMGACPHMRLLYPD